MAWSLICVLVLLVVSTSSDVHIDKLTSSNESVKIQPRKLLWSGINRKNVCINWYKVYKWFLLIRFNMELKNINMAQNQMNQYNFIFLTNWYNYWYYRTCLNTAIVIYHSCFKSFVSFCLLHFSYYNITSSLLSAVRLWCKTLYRVNIIDWCIYMCVQAS